MVGKASLFGKLATTRTAIGQRALAGLLLEPTLLESARLRQLAVQELTPALDLREQIALLGASKFEEIPAETYEQWLEVKTEGACGVDSATADCGERGLGGVGEFTAP